MTGGRKRFLNSWADYGLLLCILSLSAWLHWTLYPYAFDDAYIHFRIAEQFLEHGAPYYNPGQAVMASSSTAWTLLLTLLFWVATPSPGAVAAINCLILTLGTLVFSALAYELRGDQLRRTTCWLFALPYFGLVHLSSVGLMETPLAMLVLGGALWLDARGRPEAYALFALAPFLRLELAVFLVLFASAQLWSDRRGIVPRVGWAGVVALPLVAYELYYFGTLIPHPVYAKSAVYSISYATALVLMVQPLVSFTPLLTKDIALAGVVAAFLLLAALCVRAERHQGNSARPGNRTLYLTGIAGVLIGLGYIIPRGLVFPWYLPLLIVPLLLTLFVTAAGSRSAAAKITFFLVVMVPSVWVLSDSVAAASGRTERFQFFKQNARARQFLAVGETLFEKYPDARLMSSEIGGLGYGFDGEILDAVGLLTPGALKHHPMSVPEQRGAGFIGAIPAAMVEELRPELIVGLDIFVEDLVRAPIMEEYVHTKEPIYIDEDRATVRSKNLWWSRNLNIYTRRDLCQGEESPPC